MAGELNQNLRFWDLTEEEQATFCLHPAPELVRFAERATYLYKWTQYDLVNPENQRVSAFWLPWTGFRLGDHNVPGFRELRMRYRNRNGSVGRPQEFARARNAVTEEWNAMSSIMKIQLLKPVWGFVGVTKTQRATLDPALANVALIGGDYQV